METSSVETNMANVQSDCLDPLKDELDYDWTRGWIGSTNGIDGLTIVVELLQQFPEEALVSGFIDLLISAICEVLLSQLIALSFRES